MEWGRGGRGARTLFGRLLRYFWSWLGWEAAATASELTCATWGRRRRRAGLLGGGAAPEPRSAGRPHLLASVSSDERRYVNPFAAGKWRAGSDQRPRSRDAAQEAERSGGIGWPAGVGAPGQPRGRGAGRAGTGTAGLLGRSFPAAATRRFRVASALAAQLFPSAELLICALSLRDSFELGTRWKSHSEKAFLLC